MSWREWFSKQKADTGRGGAQAPVLADRQESKPAMAGATPAGGTVLRASDAAPEPVGAPSAPRAIPHFSIGDRIADTYEVKRIIEGGMSTVYVCYHERWKVDLVVKVPKEDILSDPEHAHRIEVEAEAWTELGLHPHIAYCYYVHPLDGVPLVVVEYLDGGNLHEWIAKGRCADLKLGLNLAIQFCHGLEHAHSQGLIHRDIKPENTLLTRDGALKITDFGIARAGVTTGQVAFPAVQAKDTAQVARARAVTVGGIGTYEYMAPEQWVDAHAVDTRADIFAFGVCMYEMFCGRQPYGLAVGPRQRRRIRKSCAVMTPYLENCARCSSAVWTGSGSGGRGV